MDAEPQGGAAALAHTNHVPRAETIIQECRLPVIFSGTPNFDDPLYRNNQRDRRAAKFHGGCVKNRVEQGGNQGQENQLDPFPGRIRFRRCFSMIIHFELITYVLHLRISRHGIALGRQTSNPPVPPDAYPIRQAD